MLTKANQVQIPSDGSLPRVVHQVKVWLKSFILVEAVREQEDHNTPALAQQALPVNIYELAAFI